MARKAPTPSTIKRLFALSGNQCAEPKCQKPIISEDGKVVLGEICHISAAEPKGPRYDDNMNDEERRSYSNLILLCESHHKIVDKNPQEFPVEKLIEWKDLHEESNKFQELKIDDDKAKKIISKSFNYNSGIINQINSKGDNQKVNIKNTVNNYNGHTVEKNILTKIAEVVGIISALIGIFIAIKQCSKEKVEDSYSVTVLVHGEEGRDDLILTNRGQVKLIYGDANVVETINNKGEATFKQIPASFFEEEATVEILFNDPQGEPYKGIYPDSIYRLKKGEYISLEVKLFGLDRVRGIVKDLNTGDPIDNVRISISGIETYSNRYGEYELSIPNNKQKKFQTIRAIKQDYELFELTNVPIQTDSELPIMMNKKVN